jgi:hypothetical protein
MLYQNIGLIIIPVKTEFAIKHSMCARLCILFILVSSEMLFPEKVIVGLR